MNFEDYKKYEHIYRKLKTLKQFYGHFIVFGIVSTFLLIRMFLRVTDENTDFVNWAILTFVISWAIGVLIHYWIAFGSRFIFLKGWEERKIKEFMGKDKRNWE